MLRNRAVALLLCCTASTLVFALGLGPLQSTSSLNEPFTGRIEITGASRADFDTLKVSLAGREQFERVGIDFNPVVSALRFRIDDSSGDKTYIDVSSKDPVREPFLNFLLEVNWLNGRLLREYTVLIDPPLYDPNRRRAPSAAPAAAPPPRVEARATTRPPESTARPAPPAATAGRYAAGREIGPIGAGETLWSLASAYRPDESVTVQQMMLAILRENPQAFGDDNVNLLRRGAVLRLPAESSLGAVSPREAFAEVQRQHELWQRYRSQAAASVDTQPVGAPAAAAPGEAMVAEADGARLELVAPGADADGGGTPGSASVGTGSDLLRDEDIDTRTQLAADLETKLTEAEEIIDILQRQVNIKDEELAALQARLAELGIDHGDIGAAADAGEDVSGPVADEDPLFDTATADTDISTLDLDVDGEDLTDGAADTGVEEAAASTAGVDDGGAEPSKDMPPAARPPEPPMERGFPGNLVPEHVAALVPGGSFTILGIGAALVLAALVAGVVAVIRRRGGDDGRATTAQATATGAAAATATPAAAEEETAAPTDVPDDDTLSATPAFDPDATIEATAADSDAATDIPVAQAQPDAEDPLEEVNVYLAYERFDQAEELVKRVIEEYPDRHEYKLRLLEVYYSSNDRGAYELAARDLFDAVGADDPLWSSAMAMWSEMSPERELFADGAVEEAAPAPDSASAFVDITGDSGDIGEDTLSQMPGDGDETRLDLEFGETGDMVQAPDVAPGDGEIIDITSDGAAEELFDLTGGDERAGQTLEFEVEDEMLDITGGDAPTRDDEMLDITGGDAPTSDDEMLEIGAGSGETQQLGITGDAADQAAPKQESGSGVFDLDSLDDTHSGAGDLLDVTHSGDVSGVEDGDLLNVTAPGLRESDEPAASIDADDTAELEITDDKGEDDAVLDFDISEATTPAGEDDTARPFASSDDDFLDLTGGQADEDDDATLDFDIGGLDEERSDDQGPGASATSNRTDVPTAGGGPESETIDMDAAFDTAQERDEAAIDFDITMGSDDLDGALDVVENEDDDGGLEITMSSRDDDPLDGELSLQGDDLDELALDDGKDSDEEFDLSLDGTMDMYSVAAGDTVDMATMAAPADGGDLENAEAVLDTVEIEAYQPEAEQGDQTDELTLDDDATSLDLDFDDERTVIMPGNEGDDEQMASDDADTKLNLAKAYIELGDTDGARSILAEVSADGSDAQKAEARTLLAQLSA